MTIQYAYLQVGNLNREDVVISTTPNPIESNVLLQYDDTNSSQDVLNTVFKIVTKMLEDREIIQNLGAQVVSLDLSTVGDLPSSDVNTVLGATPTGVNTVRLQFHPTEELQRVAGTLFKILVVVYPKSREFIEVDGMAITVDGQNIFE